MRAETGSGLPTPVCWASMSMVSLDSEPFRRAGETRWSPFWAQNAGCVSPRGGGHSTKSKQEALLVFGTGAQWQPGNPNTAALGCG